MAKWKELASIFGLELEEKFKIKQNGEVYEEFYRFTEKGIQWKSANGWCPGSMDDIEDLLMGKAEVIKMPWKPRNGEAYWYYCPRMNGTCGSSWSEYSDDLCYWKTGNCFKIEEEARTKGKEIMEGIKKEYEKAWQV